MAVQFSLKPRPISPPVNPFSWDDLSTSPSDDPTPAPANAGTPPISYLPAKDMKTFGLNPLRPEYGTGVVRCKHCKKPVLRSAFSEHMREFIVALATQRGILISFFTENCEKIRALPPPKKLASKTATPELKKGTKRKAEEEPEAAAESAPKKKKAAPKITKGRFKGMLVIIKSRL